MPRKRPAPNANASCSIARFQRVAPHLRNYSERPVATVKPILNVLSIAASQRLQAIAVVDIATPLQLYPRHPQAVDGIVGDSVLAA